LRHPTLAASVWLLTSNGLKSATGKNFDAAQREACYLLTSMTGTLYASMLHHSTQQQNRTSQQAKLQRKKRHHRRSSQLCAQLRKMVFGCLFGHMLRSSCTESHPRSLSGSFPYTRSEPFNQLVRLGFHYKHLAAWVEGVREAPGVSVYWRALAAGVAGEQAAQHSSLVKSLGRANTANATLKTGVVMSWPTSGLGQLT